MTTYTPQAGTIAARVLAHLRALPPGTMHPAAVISDALDCDADIGPFMKPSLDHGLVAREKRDGRYWWGIPKHEARPPGAVSGDDEPDDAPLVQRTVKAQQGGVALTDVPRWQGLDIDKVPSPPAPAPCPAPQLKTAPKPRAKTAPTPPIAELPPPAAEFRCALWSDGRLHIETYPGNFLLLTKEETRQLVHYLERMGESADA